MQTPFAIVDFLGGAPADDSAPSGWQVTSALELYPAAV
jgi:hypothetical protein